MGEGPKYLLCECCSRIKSCLGGFGLLWKNTINYYNDRNLFPIVLEDEKLKTKMLINSVSGKGLLSGSPTLHMSSDGRKGKRSVFQESCKGTNPIHEGSTSMI